MILKWNQIYNLSTTAKINTVLFADDQVITADSKENLRGKIFYFAKHRKILELKYHEKNLRLWHI